VERFFLKKAMKAQMTIKVNPTQLKAIEKVPEEAPVNLPIFDKKEEVKAE